MGDINKKNKSLIELNVTSTNTTTTTRQSSKNVTKLDEFADVACSIEEYQVNPLNNTCGNKNNEEETHGNNIMELQTYMKKIITNPLEFEGINQSCNAAGKSYVRLGPATNAQWTGNFFIQEIN